MEPITWTAIATIAAALISGVAGWFGTKRTNQTSQAISNQNISFQQAENEITRFREDNAIQRSAADMQAAGLSKTLAAGSPASAAALSAPQASYQNESPMAKAVEKMNLKQTILDLKSLQADVAQKQANIDYTNSLTAGQLLSNQTFMENFNNEQAQKLGNIELMKSQVAKYDAETALTNSLAPYQVEKIKVDIDKALADIDYTKILGEHAKAQTDYINTQNDIAKVDKSYRAAYWSNEFRFKDAQIDKLNAETNKISYDIAESIARTEHLGHQDKLLVQDLVNAQLTEKILQQNLNYATNHNLPVGYVPSGLLGGLATTGTSLGSALVGMFTGNYHLPVGWK